MKHRQFVLLVLLIFIPSFLAACDMFALIGIQNTNIGTIRDASGAFNDPHDYFNFLRQRSGPRDAEIPLNNDGYGVVYYKDGSTIVNSDQRFYKTGSNIWYVPQENEVMEIAEAAVTDQDNEAVIIFGHDRRGTGGQGSHPFVMNWNDRTYTFMHNGWINNDTKAAMMNKLGPLWFIQHPSNWYGNFMDVTTFIDSEILFNFIMSKIIAEEGDVVKGITAALNDTDILGIDFRSIIFNAEAPVNFVMSDGSSLYVFRNTIYNQLRYNLSYNVIDDKFIGIKTQDRLENLMLNNQLVVFEHSGNITTHQLGLSIPEELVSLNGLVALNGETTLCWQTVSDTGMQGFNVFRSDTDLFADAQQINTELISGLNNVNGSLYQFQDSQAVEGEVYYYWLRCLETSGADSLVANISMTIPSHDNPDVPPATTTYMLTSYPNPFKSGKITNFPIHLKSGDAGSLTIYNIKGQKIREYSVSEGTNHVTWDGRNALNHLCGPGVYLTRLHTREFTVTKKVLILQ